MLFLRVNETSTQGKAFAEYAKTLSYVEIVEPEKVPNAETIKAINDARDGTNIKRYKNANEMFKALKIESDVQD